MLINEVAGITSWAQAKKYAEERGIHISVHGTKSRPKYQLMPGEEFRQKFVAKKFEEYDLNRFTYDLLYRDTTLKKFKKDADEIAAYLRSPDRLIEELLRPPPRASLAGPAAYTRGTLWGPARQVPTVHPTTRRP